MKPALLPLQFDRDGSCLPRRDHGFILRDELKKKSHHEKFGLAESYLLSHSRREQSNEILTQEMRHG